MLLHVRFCITAEIFGERSCGKLEPIVSEEVVGHHKIESHLVRKSGPLNLYTTLKAAQLIPKRRYLDFIDRVTKLLVIVADRGGTNGTQNFRNH